MVRALSLAPEPTALAKVFLGQRGSGKEWGGQPPQASSAGTEC